MAVSYQHLKRYQNLYGLDLKGNDLETNVPFATDLRNVQLRKNGSIEKRPGYQARAESVGGYGLFVYQRLNPETFQEEPIVLACSNTVHRLNKATFTVTYSGSDSVCFLVCRYSPQDQEYRFTIQEGETVVLDTGLGKGFDELSSKTIFTLMGEIDAVAGFNASTTSPDFPAAFLPTITSWDLTGGPWVADTFYWEEVNTTKPFPLAGSENNQTQPDFENVTSTQMRNSIFLANGYDDILKYDGQTLYRAGIPDVDSITSAVAGAGSISGSNFVYKAQYRQIDAVNQYIEGNVAIAATLAPTPSPPLASNSVDVTVANIQNGSGFNTNCGIVVGNQGPVNIINVDDGSGNNSTLKTGDTAYFYDQVSASYVTRKIVDSTGATIEIEGAPVTVNDNDVISNNLRIRLFRNKSVPTAPTVWYELIEVPNNAFAATQVVTDNTPDSGLLFQFVDPDTDRSPPVAGRYISQFQGLMVTAGNLSDPNTVSYSDFESPEYFPVPDNQLTVSNNIGDKITGIGQSNDSFIIFQSSAIYAVTGDVTEGAFRLDRLSADIGCSSHASIQDVKGLLMFMSPQGPRYISGLSLPRAIGAVENNPLVSRIDPAFEQRGIPPEQIFRQKRVLSLNDKIGEKYWLFVPCETLAPTNETYANQYSVCFVYDYTRDAWLKFDNINAAGGIIAAGNEIFFVERRFSEFEGGVRHLLYRQNNSGTYFDYNDNTEPVSAYWKSPWEFLNEASILKSFLSLRVFSTETLDSEFTLTVKTERDFIEGAQLSEIDLTIGSGGYGSGIYGEDPYGDIQEPALMTKLNNSRLKALRVTFENIEPQKNVSITGYELEIAAPYKKVFKQ